VEKIEPTIWKLPGSSRLARAIVETVEVPLLVLDDRMVVLSANPAFLDAFQLGSEGVLGHSLFTIADGLWDQDRLREQLLGVLPARTEFRALELRVSREGGDPRFLLLNARQVELEGEEQNLILLTMEDVTVQEELRAQVQRHLTQVERSNRDLQEFAHSASHDLQEPLRKIRTYAHRLLDRLPPESLGETERRYLERMAEAAERMQQRIDDILSLGRLGRTTPDFTRVELAPLLRGVIEDLETSMEASAARIEIRALPELEGDPAQLRLLFQNLLSNALKFHRPGVPPHIEIGAAPAQAGIRITIRDNGIGFAPQYAERIFRPFERLHGRESYQGTGIGLSICRRIMENHEGSIEATSSPEAGACFTLVFPDSTHRKIA
jgi:PAS domain S-box-containing protein